MSLGGALRLRQFLRFAALAAVLLIGGLLSCNQSGQPAPPPPGQDDPASVSARDGVPAATVGMPTATPGRPPTSRPPAATSTPTPSTRVPPPVPTPNPVTFKFGKLVAPGDRAVLEAGVSLASDYIEELAGVKPAGITTYVYVDLSNVSVQWEGIAQASGVPAQVLIQGLDRYVAEAFPGSIFINTGSAQWKALSAVEQLRLAVHEYFHTVQMTLIGPENAKAFYSSAIQEIGIVGPNWLLEGSAEYISWRVLEHLELGNLDHHMASRPVTPISPRDLGSYADFYSRGQPSYDASLDAVYRLAGGDVGAVVNYYRLLGYGIAWPDAFILAFGSALDDFYADYDQLLSAP
jgi:hypothetical protein